MTSIDQIPAILDELEAIYDSSVANLRAALNAYAREGVKPDRKARDVGAFAYPELRIAYEPEGSPPTSSRAARWCTCRSRWGTTALPSC